MRGMMASVCLVGAACGGDSNGPQVHNVQGSYNYQVPSLRTQGVTCRVHAVMALAQQGTTFDGTYTGALICNADSVSVAGTVVNGRLKGDSVFFDMDNTDWHDVGVLTGTDMAGIVNVRITVNGAPVTLAGNFTATRL
ncbi:MAG TPA: hypothetical protein VFO67_08375 [Gemmatimonadales bacterium]|nr:hypothetical protein [Gemmatimonadales bacterium]